MTLWELYDLAEKEGIEVDCFPMREVKAVSFPQGWIAIDVPEPVVEEAVKYYKIESG